MLEGKIPQEQVSIPTSKSLTYALSSKLENMELEIEYPNLYELDLGKKITSVLNLGAHDQWIVVENHINFFLFEGKKEPIPIWVDDLIRINPNKNFGLHYCQEFDIILILAISDGADFSHLTYKIHAFSLKDSLLFTKKYLGEKIYDYESRWKYSGAYNNVIGYGDDRSKHPIDFIHVFWNTQINTVDISIWTPSRAYIFKERKSKRVLMAAPLKDNRSIIITDQFIIYHIDGNQKTCLDYITIGDSKGVQVVSMLKSDLNGHYFSILISGNYGLSIPIYTFTAEQKIIQLSKFLIKSGRVFFDYFVCPYVMGGHPVICIFSYCSIKKSNIFELYVVSLQGKVRSVICSSDLKNIGFKDYIIFREYSTDSFDSIYFGEFCDNIFKTSRIALI